MSEWEDSSLARVVPPAQLRKLAKVPFVELADGRLQGIVSSGSDLKRVYVSSVAAVDLAYTCRTNNNRPCGGAHGFTCGHIASLAQEARLQFGDERILRYLRIAGAENWDGIQDGLRTARPADDPEAVTASVFARFLRDLALLDVPGSTEPLPDMQWFPSLKLEA